MKMHEYRFKFSLKSVPMDRIEQYSSIGSDNGLGPPGDKPLSAPMMISFLTHICVIRPHWFKSDNPTAVGVLLSLDSKRFKCALIQLHHVVQVISTNLHVSPRNSINVTRQWKLVLPKLLKKIMTESVIDDVKNVPFFVFSCDIFDDENDRLWGFSKSLSSVIDSNAPTKKEILKKPSVPYGNSHRRRAIQGKNMLYNAYKNGPVKWDDIRVLKLSCNDYDYNSYNHAYMRH